MSSIGSLSQSYLGLIADSKAYLVLVPAYVGSVVLEGLLYRFILRKQWSEGEALPNLVSAVVGAVVGVVLDSFAGMLFATVYIYLYRNCHLSHIPITWWGFSLAYLGYEFCHYAQHRLQHRTGLFWSVHSVHHSSNEMSWSHDSNHETTQALLARTQSGEATARFERRQRVVKRTQKLSALRHEAAERSHMQLCCFR